MNLKIIRKLAKSNKYQLIYSRVKELSMLKLFNNCIDLTRVQIFFLYWLEVYSSLYSDIARKEELIDDEVISDDIRTDAYLVWKSEKSKEKPKGKSHNSKRKTSVVSGIPTVIFKNRK